MEPSKETIEPKKRQSGMNGWECARMVISQLITSGYGFILILAFTLVGWTWVIFGGMDSSDKKTAFLAIIGWPGLTLSGWILAIAVIVGARYLLKFQAASYEKQLGIMRETKNKALQIQESLKLDNDLKKED